MPRLRRVLILITLLVVGVVAAEPVAAGAAPVASGDVALGPATALNRKPQKPPVTTSAPVTVRIAGNRLVDGAGRPVRLLGVNRAGTEYACAQGWGIFDGPTDAASISAMTSWGTSAVRVPLNESCWLGINGVGPAVGGHAYRVAIMGYVRQLHAAGLVVILDLHWNAPGTRKALRQQVMADADHAPAFWTSVAATFLRDPGVVFDLFNEPHNISWPCWRDGCTTSAGWATAGMQTLLDAVRATGATQPALAGGLNYAGDLSGWLNYRPKDPAKQLGASAHIYSFSQCNTRSCWDRTIAPVAAAVPVVTTELGSNDCSPAFTNGYLHWADAHSISYVGWTWNTYDCAGGPALISSYDGTPTAMGTALRSRLLAARARGDKAALVASSRSQQPG